jgi:hypothetical protein
MTNENQAVPSQILTRDIPTSEEPEIIEAEGKTLITDVTPTFAHMDAVIMAASRLEEFGKARTAIMNFIIKQSYPGDWISHSMESVNKMDRSANLGAAGCERIANLLGIQEMNWKKPVKEWSENRLHFTYVTEADFSFAGRTIHVIHRVGTRDTFWTTEYEWKQEDGRNAKKKIAKPMNDIREDYIEKASFRGARKEGVRTLLGLRNVPLAKLHELGFNIEEVRYASFKSDKKIEHKESGKIIGAQAGDGLKEYTINVKEISEQRQGKKGPFYWITDVSGDKFLLSGDETSDKLKLLRAAEFAGAKVKIKYAESGDFKYIREVSEVEAGL